MSGKNAAIIDGSIENGSIYSNNKIKILRLKVFDMLKLDYELLLIKEKCASKFYSRDSFKKYTVDVSISILFEIKHLFSAA